MLSVVCRVCVKAAGLHLAVDPRIREFIEQRVADGVHSVSEMARHCKLFVKHQLLVGQPLPSSLNRRYFSIRRDITNIVYCARSAAVRSTVDQENILSKTGKWTGDSDKFHFRPYVADTGTSENVGNVDNDDVTFDGKGQSGLLLVHERAWQKRLLERYGNMCLLDATYKTTRYAVPLFFVCVRTNVDYVVVATFVTQYEDSASIAEALEIVTSWNPQWTPRQFMVDFCEPEISALQQVFAGTAYHINI